MRAPSIPLPAGSRIAVVGAGVVGTSAALVLAERGYRVSLFDRDGPGLTGPSWGNAGHVVGSGIFPLAEPGILLQAIRMLADPEAPLKLPAGYAREILPWLWRFWRSSRGRAYDNALKALVALSSGVVEETEALFARAGMPERIRRAPALYLYESERSYREALPHWTIRDRVGLKSTHLAAAEIREREPALAPIFPRGVLSHEWAIVTDPYQVVQGYFAAALRRGARFEQVRVDAIEARPGSVELAAGGRRHAFHAVLVAAGIWSRPLAQAQGDVLPVEAERGYNLTYPGPVVSVNRPLVLADRGVVVSPLEPGLRLGGWTELGGPDLPPDPARWASMRRITDAVLPGLREAPATTWMGHRPSMPDSVPVISRSARNPRVFYAVGHGHYGLSYSARTARIVAQLIGDAADERYTAYSIARFQPAAV